VRKGLLAVTGAGLLLGLLYLVETLRYPRGTPAQPGPGLFPLLVGALFLVSSIGVGLEAALARQDRPVNWPVGTQLWRFGLVALATLAYIILFPHLGHPVTGTLLMVVVVRVMGLRPWGLAIAVSLVMALGSYYLFGILLGVPLPGGF
jgi:putative tricarboxylic transport membrane protein